MGGKSERRAAAAMQAQSQAQINAALKDIEALQIPDIDKQKLQLQLMSEAGFLESEQLAREESIALDPRMRQAQMEALSQLRERGQTGLTEEDKAVQDIMLRDVAAQEQAQQKAIMQGMAERGTLDSGAQLATQLGGQQAAYTRAQNQASQNAIAAAQARREALSQSANLASGMEAQDFSRGSQERGYRQSIDQFNLQNRQNIAQQNLGIRQQDVGLQNQQQMYNKGLLQQQFENQKAVTSMKANARIGQATQQQQQADALARANAMKGNFGATLAGGLVGAGIGFATGGPAGGAMGALKGFGYGANTANMLASAQDGGLIYQDGGVAYRDGGCTTRAEDGSLMYESEGDVVGGDSYAGDRVDARLNSGEIVLNAPQQQRLMDVIRGREDLTALGDEDIIEGVPESYRNKLHGKQDKKQQMAKGFQRLIEMLGK
jgi:hypothetical protein